MKPKPMMQESHPDWMTRCMADSVMMDDMGDSTARRAACEIMWGNRGKEGANTVTLKSYATKGGYGSRGLDLPMEIKLIGDAGAFSGYAAVFGNVDLGGDIIERGAFKEFVTTKDNHVRVLYQHDARNPIGKALVREDSKGLAFDGSLVLEDATARKAYAMMKAGIIDAMSIGYDVIQPNGSTTDADGTRHLHGLKLWEISVTTFAMNQLASIDAVKAAQQITNIREYEDFLREVGGFSKAQAKLLAKAWNTMPGQRDVDGEVNEDVKQLVEFLSMRKFTA